MSREVMARMGRRVGVPPVWTAVLAVIAHPDEATFGLDPDEATFGLGAILDAFVFAGARVEVLCLTHGQAWTLQGAPGDLAVLRGAELASAADVRTPIRAKMQDWADGALCEVCQSRLGAEVVAAADSCHPDGLLVFDTAAVTSRLDYVAASSAGLLAAETLGLPVLGWALSETAATQLKQELTAGLIGHQGEEIDLRVSLERTRQRVASRILQSPARPGSARWRQLELLADTQSLRWLRPPGSRRSRTAR
ncbi:MAG: PIG-L family deacetylase [Dermatophilaceae bacterium]